MVYGTPTKKGGYGGGLGSMAKRIASERQAKEAAEGPPQSTYKPVGLKSLSEEITAAKEAGRVKPAPRPVSNVHAQIFYPKKKEEAVAQPAKPRDLAAERANAVIVYPKKEPAPQQAEPVRPREPSKGDVHTIIIYPKKKVQPQAQAQPVKTEEQPAEGTEAQTAEKTPAAEEAPASGKQPSEEQPQQN